MTEENVIKKINEVIAANLPASTANEMKKFIEESQKKDGLIKELQQLGIAFKDKIHKLEVENEDYQARVTDWNTINQERAVLDMRERDCEEKERKLELTLKEKELEMVNKGQTDIFRLVDKVFGHPSVTISRTNKKNYQKAVPNDHHVVYDNQTEYSDTTETQRKE